jgi:DNA-directed RNA polymerase specialized sigma24 family protein
MRREPNRPPERVTPVQAPTWNPAVTGHEIARAEVDARPGFTAFYDQTYRRVAAALSSTLADRDLGIEAADEAMARCYAHWATVGRYDNPAGWVYRVGLNWALSWRRKLARRHTLPPPEHVEATLPADPQIAEALAALDMRLRTVVVCRILLDWSTEDTAAALQIKPGTVKSRLHRGLGRLGEMLAHFEQGHL